MPRARRAAAAARRACRRTWQRHARPRPAPGGSGMGRRRASQTTCRGQRPASKATRASRRTSPSRYGLEDFLKPHEIGGFAEISWEPLAGSRVPDAHSALVDQLLQMRAHRHLLFARDLIAQLGAVHTLRQLAEAAR